jgi:pyridoxal phosphate enzyme (YggS family)
MALMTVSPNLAAEPAALSAWRDVRARIAAAATDAGRRPGDVRLIAVSKGHGAEAILPLLQAGQRDFGENRVQEAQAKWPALKARFPDAVLHLIGPLQTNKLRDALGLFDVIHTVDRPRLAEKLAEAVARAGAPAPGLLVQVNTGLEPQKAGAAPEAAADFVASCRALGLAPRGLMCVPPLDEPPALHFALLARIAGRAGLPELSMGMSDDFETAIAFGATMVRVGTALFGPRSALAETGSAHGAATAMRLPGPLWAITAARSSRASATQPSGGA